MNAFLEYIVVFIISYVLCYIILFINKKRYKNEAIPELIYLKKVYNVKIKSSQYKKDMYIFALVNAFVVDTTYILIIYLLHNLVLRVIFGICIFILLIIICYGLIARYYLWKEGKKNV